ncbi:MAG TPA: SMC-Scp complex subunit ScpB, partial [Hyphomicrobiales bacterium]|nr:SMC-Scp complex subunit ScpB [Hyphomicrobiales bacterium]
KAAGLLSSRVPANFTVPSPGDLEGLAEDEDPLDGTEGSDGFEERPDEGTEDTDEPAGS